MVKIFINPFSFRIQNNNRKSRLVEYYLYYSRMGLGLNFRIMGKVVAFDNALCHSELFPVCRSVSSSLFFWICGTFERMLEQIVSCTSVSYKKLYRVEIRNVGKTKNWKTELTGNWVVFTDHRAWTVGKIENGVRSIGRFEL